MVYCRAYGKQLHSSATACPGCGAVQTPARESDKRILPAALLCVFLGVFGVHRFYAGKVGTGLVQLFTLGGLGVWALIDFVLIVTGTFTDSHGNKIIVWT
jgi:TM2 domain-containing membrane protein YozV